MGNGGRSWQQRWMAADLCWLLRWWMAVVDGRLFRPVPSLFLYFLLFVTAMGELGVTSMVSSEVGVELLVLEVGFTL